MAAGDKDYQFRFLYFGMSILGMTETTRASSFACMMIVGAEIMVVDTPSCWIIFSSFIVPSYLGRMGCIMASIS